MGIKPQNSNYIPPRGSLPTVAARRRWFRPVSRYPYIRRNAPFIPAGGRVRNIPPFYRDN